MEKARGSGKSKSRRQEKGGLAGGPGGGAWQRTLAVRVIVITCPLSAPLPPTTDTRRPPPCPDLVLLRFQVSPLQIEEPGANGLCPPTALLSNPLGCCTARRPESELQCAGCHLGVGPEAPKAPAGWLAGSRHCCPDLPVLLAGPELISGGDALAGRPQPVLLPFARPDTGWPRSTLSSMSRSDTLRLP